MFDSQNDDDEVGFTRELDAFLAKYGREKIARALNMTGKL